MHGACEDVSFIMLFEEHEHKPVALQASGESLRLATGPMQGWMASDGYHTSIAHIRKRDCDRRLTGLVRSKFSPGLAVRNFQTRLETVHWYLIRHSIIQAVHKGGGAF